MNRSAQGAQLAHRMLECEPEEFTFRDTGDNRAQQSQPCVHAADLIVLISVKTTLRRILTLIPGRRHRVSTAVKVKGVG
ncbi:hypothetical protein GCM10010094_76480 [Streptomyces flaveus]|uniref:Uncharacterized protein n=1 Tax=Streptomyces flaveus TaxID=66370 RepID=A0A917VP15_9ACTN|nr:hypothetical protein GCM10010094_76480 [Streptomyces flaveus]